MSKREFTVAGEYFYDRSGPVRWILSHVLRYKRFIASFLLGTVMANVLIASVPVFTGLAFNAVLDSNQGRTRLVSIALELLAVVLVCGCFDLLARFSAEVLGKRVARDARDELYLNLLGKSQTFHNRQRVGDIMARANNDMMRLSDMIVPGMDVQIDSSVSLIVTLVFIAVLNWQLLLAPLLFTVAYLLALRHFSRKLAPVADRMREEFGNMNAGLNEAIAGIEVVKATSQEAQERAKFERNSRLYRDFYVENGKVQARYLPILLLSIALVGGFLHGLFLISIGQLTIGGLVTYMGLMGMLRFPAGNSNWTFSLLQLGIAGAGRILTILREETELDENEGGYAEKMVGEIVFENVTFSYGEMSVLKNVSFRAAPGQTIAIVGQTGAGKSTLTKLVNRIYDVDSGRILVDGVDVRDWSLDALRSQVSTIEQDIFLFSRTVAENIAYGMGQQVDREAIEQAARDAQAHEFILSFKEGYETMIGERGVTLSGGQRQRIAIARALLTDPRILILDDSTSAIDSATEDEIQRAIRRLLQGRTTLLITHRLSQIRWADKILVLRQGELIDCGTHEELLARCDLYRRIFAHHGTKQQTQPRVMLNGSEASGNQSEEEPARVMLSGSEASGVGQGGGQLRPYQPAG